MKHLNTKNTLFSFAFIFGILLFASCQKDEEPCFNDALGTYIGTESCVGSNANLTMTIGTSSQEDQVVVSVSGTSVTFNGNLSSDCSTVTIPSQNVVGFTGTVSGSFNLSGNNMSGTMNFAGSVCSYNMTKQ